MRQQVRRAGLSLLVALSLMLGAGAPARAAVDGGTVDAAVTDTARYIQGTVKKPQVGSIGGEWVVLGLARSGCVVPKSYFQNYYTAVERYVKACGGVLHTKKYTEYSRVIVALSAIGKDARNVAGYDLTKPLGDFDKTVWQGINGPIWALIALDSANYPMPENAQAETQATRELYVDEILSRQLADGGFSLTGGTASAAVGDASSDPDLTGMALQALAKYQDRADVKKATEEALNCLSKMQSADGGFSSWGDPNSESVVQVIVALCELGIPLDDARFVKDGHTLLDNLMGYYKKGSGFRHVKTGDGSDQMATEQGFYALVAVQRAQAGKNSLYRMSDALTIPDAVKSGLAKGEGLEGKHADVTATAIVSPGATFPDVQAHKNQPAIETLAARGIISGKSDGSFDPEGEMTRAELAKILVAALGLPAKSGGSFSDVPADAWYASYVETAGAYGLVSGSNGKFNPQGTVTRQEAAVMATNAAALCGMSTAMDAAGVRDILAQFTDYTTSAAWARPALAFCYQEGLLDQNDLDIRPQAPIKRCEVAQVLFNLLGAANLI